MRRPLSCICCVPRQCGLGRQGGQVVGCRERPVCLFIDTLSNDPGDCLDGRAHGGVSLDLGLDLGAGVCERLGRRMRFGGELGDESRSVDMEASPYAWTAERWACTAVRWRRWWRFGLGSKTRLVQLDRDLGLQLQVAVGGNATVDLRAIGSLSGPETLLGIGRRLPDLSDTDGGRESVAVALGNFLSLAGLGVLRELCRERRHGHVAEAGDE